MNRSTLPKFSILCAAKALVLGAVRKFHPSRLILYPRWVVKNSGVKTALNYIYVDLTVDVFQITDKFIGPDGTKLGAEFKQNKFTAIVKDSGPLRSASGSRAPVRQASAPG